MKMSLLAMWVFLLFILSLSASVMAYLDPRPRPPPPQRSRLSPSPPPPRSRPSPPPQPRHVRCGSIRFPGCFYHRFRCPIGCPTTCLVDCVSCTPLCSCNLPGAICEDPRFVGGDGITFHFHGRKDQDFCLVSDSNLHINAHFIGKRNPNLKRDFTWVQSIGIVSNSYKLLVAAKPTSTWDDTIDRLDISFNNIPVSLPNNEGSKWQSATEPLVTITRITDSNRVTVKVADSFRVTTMVVPITAEESRVHGYNITDSNCFAHLELGFKFYNLTDIVDGVLGQTYRSDYVSKVKVNVPMPVMGGTRKFTSSSIFATDCSASRFGWNVVSSNSSTASQYSTLQCNSGVEGNGVVCKR